MNARDSKDILVLIDMRPGTANYDPYQLESRHADNSYSEIMAELANKLNKLRTCSGEAARGNNLDVIS